MDQFYHHILLRFGHSERVLLQQSYQAFKVSTPHSDEAKDASILNEDIVSDSEVVDAKSYVVLCGLSSARAKQVVAKKRPALARRVRREKAKALASRNFLARNITRRAKTVVDKFPNIG